MNVRNYQISYILAGAEKWGERIYDWKALDRQRPTRCT